MDDLDLHPLFILPDPGEHKRYCAKKEINKVSDTLDQKIFSEIEDKIGKTKIIEKEFIIKNTHRAVGTRISYYLLKKYGYNKLEENFLTLKFKGSAGQSFGAFGMKGLKLLLEGDANDYVAKGLSGASISIKLPEESNLISNENTIIGNTVLYGATSGKLFAAGQAGERFAVRNSGAVSVVEGCSSNGCEYMTGGTIVILGEVGDNFAAGMTGGIAFIYDLNEKCNFFLDQIIKTRNKSLSNRLVHWLLNQPISDGGQSNMIFNLLQKYGSIPKQCMRDSYHTNNSYILNNFLNDKLREYAMQLRTCNKNKIKNIVLAVIKEIYNILVIFLGEPPKKNILELL